MKYSEERRQSVLAKLNPPHNRTVREVAAEEGISEPTVYLWRKQARERGELYLDAGSDAQGWRARDKFAAVIETASMNESERSEYCRKRGLYPEQLAAWRRACEQANDWAEERTASQVKADRVVKKGHPRYQYQSRSFSLSRTGGMDAFLTIVQDSAFGPYFLLKSHCWAGA